MTVDDLIAFRKSADLSQSELADLLGMSMRALQDIENGRSKLRRVHVYAIERLSLRLAVGLRRPELILKGLRADLDALEAPQ